MSVQLTKRSEDQGAGQAVEIHFRVGMLLYGIPCVLDSQLHHTFYDVLQATHDE
jgi:hypothetical protein